MRMRRMLERARRGVARRRPRPTQLVMWFPASSPVPEHNTPGVPFALQGFRPGEEAAWAELLAESGELGRWDRQRIQAEIEGALVLEGQRFVYHGDRMVACAGVYDRAPHGVHAWEIGWVATQSAYRGRGLGACVTAAALAVCRRHPERPVYLRTDDFRLAAISCYLKLGFIPDCTYCGHAARWRALRSALAPRHARLLLRLPHT